MRSMIIAAKSSTPKTIPAIAAERRVRKRAARRRVSTVRSLSLLGAPCGDRGGSGDPRMA
jgi:hypothetical protein